MGGTSLHNESSQAEGAPNCFPTLLSLVRVGDSGEEEGESPPSVHLSLHHPPCPDSQSANVSRHSALVPPSPPLPFIYLLFLHLFI